MRTIFYAILTIALLYPMITFSQSSDEVDSIAGCYSIQHAHWPDSLSHLLSPDEFPKFIKLTTQIFTITIIKKDGTRKEVKSEGDNAYKIEPMEGKSFGYDLYNWKLSRDSSIEISPHLAFVGFVISLSKVDEKLVGTIRSFTDYTENNRPYSGKTDIEFLPEKCPDSK